MNRRDFLRNAAAAAALVAIPPVVGKALVEDDNDRLERMLNSGIPVYNDYFELTRPIHVTNTKFFMYGCEVHMYEGAILKLKDVTGSEISHCHFTMHHNNPAIELRGKVSFRGAA